MKAILEFVLPEEQIDHDNAIHGASWQSVVWELDQRARGWLKHGHSFKSIDEALEMVRQLIQEEMETHGLQFGP